MSAAAFASDTEEDGPLLPEATRAETPVVEECQTPRQSGVPDISFKTTPLPAAPALRDAQLFR